MKLIVREHVNSIVEVTKREFSVNVTAIDSYGKIPESIGQTKGDLIAYRAAADPVRLPVGTPGKVLTADPTQPTGLRWGDAAGGSSGTTLLKNAAGIQILAGTILAVLPADQILSEREAAKAQRYCDQQLFIAKEDAAAGEDVECYFIPGQLCQVLVTGACDYGDPLVVSSTAGIAEALPSGTPTVGIAMQDKASSATALVSVLLVENKTLGINNADSASHSAGTVYAFSGGYDTDGFGLVYSDVKPANYYDDIPAGVQANSQSSADTLGIMHYRPGEIVKVLADDTRIDVGDWLVMSETDGIVRSGIGPGIGHAISSKAGGSAGKVRCALQPCSDGKGPKKYLYFNGKANNSWNGSLQYKTGGGIDYTMVRTYNNGYTMLADVTGTGTEELCLFCRSASVDVTNYSKCVIRFGYRSGNLSSPWSIFYGMAKPNTTTINTNTQQSLFDVYKTLTPATSKSTWDYAESEIDISSLSGSYDFCLDYAQANMSGNIQIAIQYVYLM
jgi:hypothetical protein